MKKNQKNGPTSFERFWEKVGRGLIIGAVCFLGGTLVSNAFDRITRAENQGLDVASRVHGVELKNTEVVAQVRLSMTKLENKTDKKLDKLNSNVNERFSKIDNSIRALTSEMRTRTTKISGPFSESGIVLISTGQMENNRIEERNE